MGIISEARDELDGIIKEIPWEEPLIPFTLYADNERHKARLSHIINTVAKGSPFGKALLESAANAGYSLSMEYMRSAAGCCDAREKRIFLNPSLTDDSLVSTLVHESRHAQQDERAEWSIERGWHDFVSEVMFCRASEADAQAAAVAACHEIAVNTGNKAPYYCMREGDPFIVGGFSSKKEPHSDRVTPEMFQAAFDGWYKNTSMVEAYEGDYFSGKMRQAIRSGDFSQTPYDRPLTSRRIVEAFCTDMNGECYWKHDPDVLSDRNKLSICSGTRKVADKFFKVRQEKTGKPADLSYSDLKVRDGEASFSESVGLLKRAFSGEYLKSFARDLKAEVDFEKEGSLLEKQRMNHLVNELCKDANAKKAVKALKAAGYSLAMESLGKSVSVRDERNKVVILARQASDRSLKDALLKEAKAAGASEAARLKFVSRSR